MFKIGVAALIGGLSGGLAVLIARAVPSLREKGGKAIGVLTALLFGVGNQTLAPEIHAWKLRRDVDVLLRDDMLYSSILADHPELRQPLRTGLLQAMKQPHPGEAAVQVGAKLLAPSSRNTFPAQPTKRFWTSTPRPWQRFRS